jgi:hypothetical protein
VSRITLIGIIGDQLVLEDHKERFPDRRYAVIRDRWSTNSNVALKKKMMSLILPSLTLKRNVSNTYDKLPGKSMIGARIEVYLGMIPVCRDGVTRTQHCSCFERADIPGQFVQEGLATQTPAIYLIGTVGDMRPGMTQVSAAEDWKIGRRRFGRVVFPGCEDNVGRLRVVLEDRAARVNDARRAVGRRRLEYVYVVDQSGGRTAGYRCGMRNGEERGDKSSEAQEGDHSVIFGSCDGSI